MAVLNKEDHVTISGVGCCLVDVLYSDINFHDPDFQWLLSKQRGDGGLNPGHLVFVEELESFSGEKLSEILSKVTKGRQPDKINVGGPSIVALINASQILDPDRFKIRFYGKTGHDNNGNFLLNQLQQTQVDLKHLNSIAKPTPNTVVLSDPDYDEGTGERLFINSIGAAWEMTPQDLDEEFFSSDYVVFGATALTPFIHDNLLELLQKAKQNGCKTVVNTVFDFRNEKKDPTGRWPLGKSDLSYQHIDLLIMDKEESLRLSGSESLEEAAIFFQQQGCSSFIITDGSRDILAYSDGRLFKPLHIKYLPVSSEVRTRLQNNSEGDTTGCGDNFAGGVIASLAEQSYESKPDLIEACSWGVISGGFSCFYMGGTYSENCPGHKLSQLKPLYESYCAQIRNS
jgi:sugar/nucleoside kinase (ribokinase family)